LSHLRLRIFFASGERPSGSQLSGFTEDQFFPLSFERSQISGAPQDIQIIIVSLLIIFAEQSLTPNDICSQEWIRFFKDNKVNSLHLKKILKCCHYLNLIPDRQMSLSSRFDPDIDVRESLGQSRSLSINAFLDLSGPTAKNIHDLNVV
jgi:hypothetical protein